jgi:nicotinate dehydrogenase subunit B
VHRPVFLLLETSAITVVAVAANRCPYALLPAPAHRCHARSGEARRAYDRKACVILARDSTCVARARYGAVYGLFVALGEEVTWDDRKVTSVDWRSYHSLPLGFEVPVIESVLINRTDGKASGAGETAITIVAAAVGNAIFDATGARVREVPFTAERVSAALRAR